MSSPIVLSSPATLPPEVAPRWEGMSLLWVSDDGEIWDLGDERNGVVLRDGGVEGLHFPQVTRFTSRSRAIPGSRTRGWRAEERQVFWPLLIWSDTTLGWMERQSRFFNSVRPGQVGTWSVRSPAGRRTLRIEAVSDGSHAYEIDPAIMGWAMYGQAFVAPQPYWSGETVTAGPWVGAVPEPFFPDGGGPPLHISQSQTFGTARVRNVGDVEAWAVWTAAATNGDLSDVVLGVDGALIEVPFVVPEGQQLRIDTDPRRPTAQMGAIPAEGEPFVGADVTRLLGLQSYAPIPPQGSVPVTVDASGAGEISAELTPLFFRAF